MTGSHLSRNHSLALSTPQGVLAEKQIFSDSHGLKSLMATLSLEMKFPGLTESAPSAAGGE